MNAMACTKTNILDIPLIKKLANKTIEQAILVLIDKFRNIHLVCGQKFGETWCMAPSIHHLLGYIRQAQVFFTEAVIVHNHPRLPWHGALIPSPEDIGSTELIKWQLLLLGITLSDHIIVSEDKKCSFFEFGMLNQCPIKIIGFEIKRFLYCFLQQLAITFKHQTLETIVSLLEEDLFLKREFYEGTFLQRLFKTSPGGYMFKQFLMTIETPDPIIKRLISILISIDDGKNLKVYPEKVLPYGIELQKLILGSDIPVNDMIGKKGGYDEE